MQAVTEVVKAVLTFCFCFLRLHVHTVQVYTEEGRNPDQTGKYILHQNCDMSTTIKLYRT